MIIRATQQLLRLSGIQPVKNTDEPAIPVMRDRIEDIEFEDIFRTGKELKDITTPARILHELMAKLS